MSIENKEKKKSVNIFKVFIRLAPLVLSATPVMSLISALISIFHGVSWGVETMMQQRFFDSATLLVKGDVQFSNVLLSLAILGGANMLCQVLNGIGNFMPSIMVEKIMGKLSIGINEKIARLAPIDFENTDKLDDINKAEQGKNNAMWFVLLFCTVFLFYIPYFLFMGWYLFSLKPILAISIVLVFIPTALTQLVRTKVFTKLEDKSAPVRREYDYYESCITGREYFKETRLLGGFSYFRKLYIETLDLLQNLRFKATMKTNLIEFLMRLITVAGYYGILMMLFSALMNREITVGAFAAVFNSIGMLYGIMEEVICRHIGSLAQNVGTIQNYISFLDMEERKGNVDVSSSGRDIILENVSFSYPGCSQKAVKNVSFTIHAGETLAIVGENGSGKSTLIRLICGLYTPDEGCVLHGDTNTEDMTNEALFKNSSAVFQKYQKYHMTLEENLSISKPEKKYDESDLDKVCDMAGCDPNHSSFPAGYKTMLSREYDGVDISGGQWQQIAIARGFFRDHTFIILDEPTAAIDPYEETRIYNRFAKMSKDKTAIIVTHRLGSVKLARRIIVMKDGEAVQIGTHEELIRQEGEYKRLYRAQEQWYKETPVPV